MSSRLICLRLLYQLDIWFPIFVAVLFVLSLITFRVYCSIILNPTFRKWDNSRKCKYLVDELHYNLVEVNEKFYLVPEGVSYEALKENNPRIWNLDTLTNYTWREIKQGYKEPVVVPKFLCLMLKLVGGVNES